MLNNFVLPILLIFLALVPLVGALCWCLIYYSLKEISLKNRKSKELNDLFNEMIKYHKDLDKTLTLTNDIVQYLINNKRI